MRATAFLVWQRDHDRVDPLQFDPVLEQVRITTIEYLTDLNFPDLRSADPLRFGAVLEQETRQRAISSSGDVKRRSMGEVASANHIVL